MFSVYLQHTLLYGELGIEQIIKVKRLLMKTRIINHTTLWDNIARYAKRAGRKSMRPILLLYCVMMSEKTPKSDKIMILSALSYIVLPIKIKSLKRLPVISIIDELMSLTMAYRKVRHHITPDIRARVEEQLDRWFPEYTPYIEV